MDEKGFLLGMAQSLKRIMTRKEYESGRIRSNKQDGSREFITLLAAICADGTAVPPALIYKGASGDLSSSWVEDVGEGDKAYFGSSAQGWSNNQFGLEWLTKVFNPATVEKATRARCRRLLIVDGHSSHVNLEFLETCDRLRIVVLILPPHSTHRLQPLDVSLFGALATAYSFEINEIMRKSAGLTSLTKRNFWLCFKAAWEKSFIPKNIESGFRRCGYWPFNPQIVLSIITPRPTTPQGEATTVRSLLKTPRTSKSIRQFQKEYLKNPSPRKLTKLFKANELLAAESSIQAFRADGLEVALKLEKKKRTRGKRLGLNGKEVVGAQLFGVAEIQEARDFQARIEAEKEATREAKEKEKITKAISKALD
jgi:hypothetical protein